MSGRGRRWCWCCRRGPDLPVDAPLSEYRSHLPPEIEWTDELERLINHWRLRYSETMYFWDYFNKLDDDNSGRIDPLEFFSFLNEPRTRLLNYIIPIISADPMEYERMDFSAWMVGVFGFCFMTDDELIQHVFQRYDSTGTGRILQNDLYKFMKQMHADNPLFPKDIVIQMSAQLDLVGYLDYETFRVMTFRFPMLFYPITRIQQAMRDRVITRKLFAALDVRTSDIYYQRVVGDRPPLYTLRKLRHYCRLLTYSLCWWRRMRSVEVEERNERRERIRREKEEVQRRRRGGVGGELWEEKRAEMEFMRARKRARRLARQRELDAAGVQPRSDDEDDEDDEEELPSIVRRKYFGTDVKQDDDPEKIKAIVRRIKTAPDVYDSDEDSQEDHFEDRQVDEYEDAHIK